MIGDFPFEQQASEFFVKIVDDHGIECSVLPDGVVASKDGRVAFQFLFHKVRDETNQKTIQLDFSTSFLNTKNVPVQIVESFAGFRPCL